MSARTIETSIDIEAEPGTVWRILMDFPAYQEWNPFIYRIEGQAIPGERLTVLIQPPGKREMEVRPTVRQVKAEREFSWLGHLLIPGLFDGLHEFLLEARSESGNKGGNQGRGRSIRFHQRKTFSGVLVPLLWGSVQPAMNGLEYMNRALKSRAESFRLH